MVHPAGTRRGATFSYGGRPGTPVTITREAGANYVRMRVWVSPPAGYRDLASDLALVRQVHAAGMKIYLDIMYSDFWGRPAAPGPRRAVGAGHGVFGNPAAVCERSAPGSSPCTVG